MQEIEFIAGKMKVEECPCFTIQSLTFKMKIVNSARYCSVAEKEGTSFILFTSALDTPLKLLPLPGLLLQHHDFCILTTIIVKIKVCEAMDLVSISITSRIFPTPFSLLSRTACSQSYGV